MVTSYRAAAVPQTGAGSRASCVHENETSPHRDSMRTLAIVNMSIHSHTLICTLKGHVSLKSDIDFVPWDMKQIPTQRR